MEELTVMLKSMQFESILMISIGVFSILASIFNCDWFFNHRKAEFFVRTFGRNGARAFYFVLGLFFFFIAYKISL